jgi:uncharacterized protein
VGNLTPTRMARHVTEITPDWLTERGIRAVLCDVDNTVVAWHSEEIDAAVLDWVETLKAANVALCLVSNTRNPKRLERLAARFGIFYVPGNAGKPGASGYMQALILTGAKTSEALMVGDQLFTDVYGANRLGIATVLVNPLSTHEFIGTKLVSRTLERLVLRGEKARP